MTEDSPGDLRPPRAPDDWQPSSRFDSLCVEVHGFVRSNLRLLVVLALGSLVFTHLSLTMVALLFHPLVAGFAILSVVPAIFLALYIWDSDPLDHRKALHIAAAFSLGAAVTGFAYLLNTLAVDWFHGFGSLSLAAFFFLWVAPVEEGLKIAAVYLNPFDSYLETALDGAVFGAFVGLGFATAENAFYILTDGLLRGRGYQTLIGRAGVAPAHVIWTATAGYYVGLAKQNPRYRGTLLLKGLVTVALLHGAYNTAVSYLPAATAMVTETEGAMQAGSIVFLLGFYGLIFLNLDRLLTRSRGLLKEGRLAALRERALG